MNTMSEVSKRSIKINHQLWVRKHDLEQAGEDTGSVDLELVAHWHSLGHRDEGIAESLGVSENIVQDMREKLGLEANTRYPRGLRLSEVVLKPVGGETNEERLSDYERGYSDKSLARRWGICRESVRAWRRRYKLEENVGKTVIGPKVAERLKDYNSGLIDDELARKWGMQKTSVKQWRDRRFLPENYKKKSVAPFLFESEKNKQRMADYQEGYTDRQLAKLWGIKKPGVSVWRKARNLPFNTEGDF